MSPLWGLAGLLTGLTVGLHPRLANVTPLGFGWGLVGVDLGFAPTAIECHPVGVWTAVGLRDLGRRQWLGRGELVIDL